MGHTTARCRLVLADLASSEVYCFVPSRLRSFRPFSLLSKKDVNFQNTKFYFFQGEYIIIINRVIIIYCIAGLLYCQTDPFTMYQFSDINSIFLFSGENYSRIYRRAGKSDLLSILLNLKFVGCPVEKKLKFVWQNFK